MGTQYTRRHKINWIMVRVRAAASQEKAVIEEKLIGEFCIAHASKRETAREILKSLESAGLIIRVESMILTPEQYDLEKNLKSKP